MYIISLQFYIFFMALLVVYYVVPLKTRWVILLLGSMSFYLLSASPHTALYLIFGIVSVYLATKYISKDEAKHKSAVYILVLCGNIAVLALFKLSAGVIAIGGKALSVFGMQTQAFSLGLLAPLGISFYTLSLISYLTDVYWGITSVQNNPAKLTLFAAYFPSISSGPILRWNQVESELFDGHRVNYQNITFGMQRMLWGVFKKLVIAERMAMIAQPIFADIKTYAGIWLWVGLFVATIQIYADFSGNMDFILGVSECFGVKLPENFRQPFFSLTVQEFWQRWHITLSNWLKDYLMYPLLRSKQWQKLGKFSKKHFGKKAAKLIPTLLAILVMWLINGVWHGPFLKYIAMVFWFWLAITVGQIIEPLGNKIVHVFNINTDCFCWRIVQRVRTFVVFSVGLLFFFSQDISSAIQFGQAALSPRTIFESINHEMLVKAWKLFGRGARTGILFVSLLLVVYVESYQIQGGKVRSWLAKQNIVLRWVILLGFIFYILLFGCYGPGYSSAEFIYAEF